MPLKTARKGPDRVVDPIVVLVPALGITLLLVFVVLVVVARFRRVPRADQALVIGRAGGERVVRFDGTLVLPGVHHAETLDLSVVTVELSLTGKDAARCKDRVRVDVEAALPVRVNRTKDDVLKVATVIGCARASDPDVVRSLYRPRFESAVRKVFAEVTAEEALGRRAEVEEAIATTFGDELDGFVLGDVALVRMSLVPLEGLDPDDPLDAEAIVVLTRRAAAAAAAANDERQQIATQQHAADLAILAFDLKKAEAEARRDAEIAIIQARERGEVERVTLEEEARTMAVRKRLEGG